MSLERLSELCSTSPFYTALICLKKNGSATVPSTVRPEGELVDGHIIAMLYIEGIEITQYVFYILLDLYILT
jgi:hypothetical protein